jgi:hypothetical protein
MTTLPLKMLLGTALAVALLGGCNKRTTDQPPVPATTPATPDNTAPATTPATPDNTAPATTPPPPATPPADQQPAPPPPAKQ